MAAAIGVQRQFQRKPLFRSQSRMFPHEAEVADLIAREKAQQFAQVRLGVLAQLRQHARVAAVGKAADLRQHLRAQRLAGLVRARPHGGDSARRDAEFE